MGKTIYYVAFILATIVLSTAKPLNINIGIFGDKFNADGSASPSGIQAIAGMVLAIREINNKKDGMYDNLLPNYVLKFALRQSYGDYLQGLVSSQDFSNKVFNGSGVIGVVGTGYDESSRAMGQLFAKTAFKVNNVDYNSHSSDLSHAAKFPYYSRICDSDGYDSRILARVIRTFGYSRVSVIATSDTYGSDSLEEFENEAIIQGLNIENTVTFWSGTPDVTNVINSLKSYGVLKVFVLLMKSADAANILTTGYKLGLFKKEAQILGTRYVMDSSTWLTYMSPDQPIKDILHGMIGIRPFLDRSTTNFQSFLQRFLAQNSTQYIKKRNGIARIICKNDTDDDGKTYLYVDNPKQASPKCAGLDIRSMNKNGTGVMDIAAYAYDAVVALATGLHLSLPPNNVTKFSGDSLAKVLIGQVDFQGATGRIEFFSGNGGDEGYGLGDRQVGLKYQVVNFNGNFDLNGAIRVLGVWDGDTSKPTICDPLANPLCSKIVFNTNSGDKLNDEPDIVEVELSPFVRMALTAGGVIAGVVALIFLIVLLLYSNNRLMKSSQPSIMVVIIIGGIIGAQVPLITSSTNISDGVCIQTMWYGHFAFACVFIALLVKVWRIGTIMKSGFSKVKITRADMYKIIAVAMGIFTIFLIIDTFIGKPHKAYEESFDGHKLVRLMKCDTENHGVSFFLFALEGVMLFYGAKLSWDAKDAPGVLNESTPISLSIYFLLFVCAIIFPIVLLHVEPTPQNLTLVTESGFIAGTIGVLMLIFSFRTKLALEGADVDENFQIVKAVDEDGNGGPSSGGGAISGRRRSSGSVSASGSKKSSNKISRLRDKIRQRVTGSDGSNNGRGSVVSGYGNRATSDYKGNGSPFKPPQSRALSRPPVPSNHSVNESNVGSARIAPSEVSDKSGVDGGTTGATGNPVLRQRSGERKGSVDVLRQRSGERRSSIDISHSQVTPVPVKDTDDKANEEDTPYDVPKTNYFLTLKTLYFGSKSPAARSPVTSKNNIPEQHIPDTPSNPSTDTSLRSSMPLSWNRRLPSVHEREEQNENKDKDEEIGGGDQMVTRQQIE